jgi:hypothetical protein
MKAQENHSWAFLLEKRLLRVTHNGILDILFDEKFSLAKSIGIGYVKKSQGCSLALGFILLG